MKKPACQIRGLEKALGPNKVLSSLINRISKDFVIKSVNKVSDLHYGQS